MLRRMGVRGRLLLAFLGISAFALIAAAAAVVGGVLERSRRFGSFAPEAQCGAIMSWPRAHPTDGRRVNPLA